MQNTYSLAYAVARDGQGVFGRAEGANDADIASPGALSADRSGQLAGLPALSETVAALTNANLKLDELAQSLGTLREGVDSLDTVLSSLRTLDRQPVRRDERTESTTLSESTSSTSVDQRQTREALMLGSAQIIDLASALQQSGSHLTLDKTARSEQSISVLREASTDSETRFSTTLDAAPVWGEALWLKARTGLTEIANGAVEGSPALASAVKTAQAVVSTTVTPMISEVLSGLGETIKSRVAGNVVDATLGRLPGIGKLFKDGGFDGEKGKDAHCCCAGPLSLGAPGALGGSAAQMPESVGDTVRRKDKDKPAVNKKRRVRLPRSGQPVARQPLAAGPRQSVQRQPRTSGSQQSAQLQPLRPAPVIRPGPALSAMGQPPVPFDAARVTPPSTQVPGNAFAAPVAPAAIRPLARSSEKGLTAGLSGTLAKLESGVARRLGPLKYVDTAIDVVQGVRNGDVNAVGAGLSTAGGAWAGASAGAALGTLVFPGVGTAIGGAIGGLLGSEAGAWLGDKVFGSSDRLPPPAALSKELTRASSDNVQVTISPSIQITGVNPADAQQVVNQVIQALQFQCLPMVTDTLGIRRNAALADPSGGD